MVKLTGMELSPGVRAVLLTANALGLEIDFEPIQLPAGISSDDFRKQNPQHRLPILDDGGQILWESHAIITYLVDKYGQNDSLYPKDLYARALVEQVLHFEGGVLSPRGRALYHAAQNGNPDYINKSKEVLYSAYDCVEQFLAKTSYMAGNSMTIADLSLLATLSSVNLTLPVDAAKYPKLADWLKRMTELPYYEKANGNGLKDLGEMLKKANM